MDILSMMLGAMTSEESLKSIESKTGVKGKDLTKLMGEAVPMMLGSMTENASSKEGAESLLNALGDHKTKKSVASQVAELDEEDGRKIVGHMLGKNSQKKAQQLSQNTGLSMDQVMKVLICLAPLLMSGLSNATSTASHQQHQQGSGFDLSDGLDLSDVMALFGGTQSSHQTSHQGGNLLGGLLGNLLGGSQPAHTNNSNNGMQLLGTLLSMMK
ncbi:DUF937 domain-containing protein [Eubacterium sp. AB3007]|uniref:DUF937 domain-containing protein n=1 Tax=Eubacterium sp. AB3007 TaxID=1392487 RepID=UPI000483DF9B|nr:DUF937 domain-containing protein [Eubacterium sp. AB3007]